MLKGSRNLHSGGAAQILQKNRHMAGFQHHRQWAETRDTLLACPMPASLDSSRFCAKLQATRLVQTSPQQSGTHRLSHSAQNKPCKKPNLLLPHRELYRHQPQTQHKTLQLHHWRPHLWSHDCFFRLFRAFRPALSANRVLRPPKNTRQAFRVCKRLGCIKALQNAELPKYPPPVARTWNP